MAESPRTSGRFELKKCLVSTWLTMRDHWPALILAAFLRDLMATLAAGIAFTIFFDRKDWIGIPVILAGWLTWSCMQCGYLKFCRNIQETNEVSWPVLFSGAAQTMDMLVATVCMWFSVALGLVALIIPGIYLAVKFSLYGMALVDQNTASEKALETSSRMLKGYFWPAAGICAIFELVGSVFSFGSYGWEALFVLALWSLYAHIKSQHIMPPETPAPEANS
ncbi:MAG: hypothetical protein JST01_25275 [Cyanobacteria bacterium SZAS TMP-1]|nr:hypothetical protein [Cyanobacteria bacterium SZAS TMP-1]